MTDSPDDKVGNQKTTSKAALFRKLLCSPANPLTHTVMNWWGKMNLSHKKL